MHLASGVRVTQFVDKLQYIDFIDRTQSAAIKYFLRNLVIERTSLHQINLFLQLAILAIVPS